MENEIWKPAPELEGQYEVSNKGRVRVVVRKVRWGEQMVTLKPHTYKGHKTKNGYMVLRVRRGGGYKSCLIHRLVAKAFIPIPDNLPFINHKNEIKDDNRVENLEWCTNRYNMSYGHAQDSKKRRIAQYKDDFYKEWDSITEAAKHTSAQVQNIIKCAQGKRHYAGGYHWKYI